jgi:hypothetical protein
MHFTTGVTSYIISALFMVIGGSAAAQDWVEYENREVGFNINFPVDPIVEAAEYVSPTGETLPAQIFVAEEEGAQYKVTVVDFSSLPGEQHIAVLQAADAMRTSGELVYEVISDLDEIYGPQFYIIGADEREVLSTIVFFRESLFIAEGSAPPGSAPPSQFQQSMGLVHADGTRPTGVNEDREARQRAFEEQRLRDQQDR